ncbi:MAG: hypothetical protein AB7U20_23845 [Planctomycetaceae bacterium]
MTKRHRRRQPRLVSTAAGDVRLVRVYFECPACREAGYPLDERLGGEGRYSRGAERLFALAGASWSYDVASARLEELCGLSVSDTTIREVSQRHGAAANEWLRSEPQAVQEFREATGDVEFTTTRRPADGPAWPPSRYPSDQRCRNMHRRGGEHPAIDDCADCDASQPG